MENFQRSKEPESISELSENISALFRALNELLEREHKVAFHDDLPALIASIDHIVDAASLPIHLMTNHGIDSMQMVNRFRSIVQTRTGMLQTETPNDAGVNGGIFTSSFPRTIVMPLNRHNNDKLDIPQIGILPTHEEIRSNYPEFLPSTDFRQPHFIQDPAQRYLDTHFRLLRHGVLGELKQALCDLMHDMERDPSILNMPAIILAIRMPISTRTPGSATFTSKPEEDWKLAYHSLNPAQLSIKKSSKEGAKWWKESRRLQPGLLLCFLFLRDDTSSFLLLTVTDKDAEDKIGYNLSSNGRQATIKAKLAGANQHQDVESLIALSCQRTKGLLIELPGVMLATFVPILENI